MSSLCWWRNHLRIPMLLIPVISQAVLVCAVEWLTNSYRNVGWRRHSGVLHESCKYKGYPLLSVIHFSGSLRVMAIKYLSELFIRELADLIPGGSVVKESACQCRRHRRYGFNPWVRKIPWRRKWQPTPVFLPGESSGKRSLGGYSL